MEETKKMLEKAIEIAIKAHKGQTDKAGMPYILHPLEVMSKVSTLKEKIVAVLHDVIEDTNITIEILKEEDFSEEILEALKLMTHENNVPYMEYIAKIKTNKLATKVKIADLEHNLNIFRIEELTEKDLKRINKYKKALKFLKED